MEVGGAAVAGREVLLEALPVAGRERVLEVLGDELDELGAGEVLGKAQLVSAVVVAAGGPGPGLVSARGGTLPHPDGSIPAGAVEPAGGEPTA